MFPSVEGARLILESRRGTSNDMEDIDGTYEAAECAEFLGAAKSVCLDCNLCSDAFGVVGISSSDSCWDAASARARL
jgi:hypothetical protein